MIIEKEWGKQHYCDFCQVLWANWELKNGSLCCDDCRKELGV